jgi:hypothetical protein
MNRDVTITDCVSCGHPVAHTTWTPLPEGVRRHQARGMCGPCYGRGGNAPTPPPCFTHIHHWEASIERQHVLDDEGSCWCGPAMFAAEFGTVVNHRGQVQPSVAASLDDERRFTGDLHPMRRIGLSHGEWIGDRH